MKRLRHQRADSSKNQFARRLGIELLEDRRLLAVGDLLQTLANPSTTPQMSSGFGYSVAADGPYTVVGTPEADLSGFYNTGVAYVFNTSTGVLVATLNNPTPATEDEFGYSVAISGNTIVVGAYGDNTDADNAGSAYVFDAVSGSLRWTLNNPTPAASDLFGLSVAISDKTIAVGAEHDGTDANGSGSVYVFNAISGNLLWTLNNPTPASWDEFGCSVAISGSTIVVGADGDDTDANGAGSAYVFDAVNRDLLWTLNNPTPAAWDEFGSSVAVSGSTVVVGAHYDDTDANESGSAYVFNATSGNLLHTLNNPTPAETDCFGSSVAVSGSKIVVGAYWDFTGANESGSAYVFDAGSGDLLRTLNNPTPADYDYFGNSVAVSGSAIVVGAVWDDPGATDAGTACVFNALSGNMLRTLNNPTPTAHDKFGRSLAISGSTIVVGAFGGADTGVPESGSAYVFDAASGSLLPTLNNPTPDANDEFGYSVAISGSTIVVGAHGDNAGEYAAGSAYVFDAASGNLLHTLNNPTPDASDEFGYSVAISGNTIVVGAHGDNTNATCAGSAYVFDAASGDLLWTLNNPTPDAYDRFGWSVAVSGSTIVVGAFWDDTGMPQAGLAYVFDAVSGDLLWTLNNPTPAADDEFGYSVAISGSTIVVGAGGDNTGTTHAGSAYVFDAESGTLLRTLNNPTPDADDEFGYSVAISGNTIVVGAYWDDTLAADAGTAYVFDAASGSLLWTMNNPAPTASDYFGCSVAASDGKALIGAYGADGGSMDRGEAYLFDVLNDRPVLSDVETAPLGYLLPTRVSTVLTVSDVDSPMLTGATVQIAANYQNPEDVLLFSNTGAITGTWNSASGTLSLTGRDTPANYQAALRTLKYQDTSAKPNLATRTISFKVNDGQEDSNLVSRNVVFYPPVLSGIECMLVTYTEKKPSVALSAKIALRDGNSPKMTGATVQITGNYQPDQDVLSLVNTKTIAGTWDQATGTLTVTGSDTVANYQKALRAVKYRNTSVNPNTAVRTVSFQVSDGVVTSNTMMRGLTVNAVNDPSVLSGIETTTLAYVAGSPAAEITSSTAVTDVDSNLLTGATIRIASGYRKGQDSLMFDGLGAITGTWNPATGILSLTGIDTPAAYQAALRTIAFQNTATKPTLGTRKISFTVTDGAATSKAVARAVVVAKPITADTAGLLDALASLRPTQSAETSRQTLFASVQNWAV